MRSLLPIFILFLFTISEVSGNQKIDSLLLISKKQLGQEHLNTILKIAEDYSYGYNGDTIIYYSKMANQEALQLRDSISILKSNLYWSSGLYSKKEFNKSLTQLNKVLHLSGKLNKPKERLKALYLKARNYQGLKEYENSIVHFIEAYEYSVFLLNKNNDRLTKEYCKGILRQLTYTYWYASKLKEGIAYFTEIIGDNKDASDEIMRSYFSNISFLYNRGIDVDKAEYYLLKAAEISNKSDNQNDIYQDQAYLGALYANIGDYPKAIDHYEQAMLIARQQNNSNKISYILQNLGLCYNANGDLQKGVDMIFDGIKLFINKDDQKAIAKAYQHLGRMMIKWHNFKDADKYLQQAAKLHKETNFNVEESIDYINLAVSKYHQQEADSSLIYLEKLNTIPTLKASTNNECMYFLNKAYVHLNLQNKPLLAKENMQKAIELVKKTNSPSIRTYIQKLQGSYYLALDSVEQAKKHLVNAWNNHKSTSMLIDQATIAKQLSSAYKKLHQTDSAYFYLQKADSINAKLHLREDVLTLYKKDNDFVVYLAKKEQAVLTKENKRLSNRIILIRVFYILLSASVVGFLIVFIKKRTKRYKSEIHKKDTHRKQLQKQSKLDKSIIDKNNKLIQAKESIIAELNEKLLNSKFNAKSTDDFNEIEALLNAKLTTEEDWDQYLQLFTLKNPSFIPELKNRFPKLSRNEIKIFILIKLGLTTREMAGILMISTSSVNTARYRLRKKLNLDTDQKIEDIIENEILSIK